MSKKEEQNKHSSSCAKCGGTGEIIRSLEIDEFAKQVPEIFKGLSKISSTFSEIKKDPKNSLLPATRLLTPRTGTKASEDYFKTFSQINDFYSFLFHLVITVEHAYGFIDFMVTLPSGARIRYKDRTTNETYSIVPPRKKVIDEFLNNHEFLLELIHVRFVENYLNYLSSLLFEIFVQRPETMKSEETIDIDTVLSHDSKNLIKIIAEKKISSLSYDSFKKMHKYFQSKFKLNICKDTDINSIIEAIELRNIIVHNRSIVDDNFIKRTQNDISIKGLCVSPSRGYTIENAIIFAESIKKLDAEARRKLKLKGFRLKSAAARKPVYIIYPKSSSDVDCK